MRSREAIIEEFILERIEGDIVDDVFEDAIEDCDDRYEVFDSSKDIDGVFVEECHAKSLGKRGIIYGRATITASVDYGYIELDDWKEQAFSKEVVGSGIGEKTFDFWIGTEKSGKIWVEEYVPVS